MRKTGIITALQLQLFRAYRRLQTSLHELNYLFWECTLRCNLHCRHCGSDCHTDTLAPDMPLADFLSVLDDIAHFRDPRTIMIAVTGGEPLLRGDLDACGRAFVERGFPWGMVTNGYCLDRRRLGSLRAAGLRSVTVSLDGLARSHDWMRGRRGSFNRAIRALELCAADPDLVCDAVSCINRKNIGELSRLRALLVRNGVRAWRLFTVFPRGRAASGEDFRLSGPEFRSVLDFIVDCRRTGDIRASYGCEGFLGEYEGKARDSFFFCRAGISVGSVLADGSVSACPSMRGDFIQGNVYQDSFMDIWENRFSEMRDRSWARTGRCASCKKFPLCNGNGLHLRHGPDRELSRCHYRLLHE